MSRNPDDKPPVAVRRAAMNLLARREHSFHELLDKLKEKFPDFDASTVLVPALERLREEKLQSDERFAASYVRYRSNRGFGPLKIAAELYPRRIDSELQQQVLYRDGIDWEQLCSQALHDKFRLTRKPAPAERMRWQRFLLQRGFSQEQISAVFKSLNTPPADDVVEANVPEAE